MPVTDDQVIRDHLDLEMLERPYLWPTRAPFPRVGVKRRTNGDWNETGYAFLDGEPGKLSYYIVARDWRLEDAPVSTHEFATAQDLLAAGWVVD